MGSLLHFVVPRCLENSVISTVSLKLSSLRLLQRPQNLHIVDMFIDLIPPNVATQQGN